MFMQVLENTGVIAAVTKLNTPVSPSSSTTQRRVAHSHALHSWGGKLHLVPQDFSFPTGPALIAWQHYCCGDESKSYPPLRSLQPTDMSSTNLRKRLSDFKFVNGLVETEAKRKSIWVDRPTLEQANAIFLECQSVLPTSPDENDRKRRTSQLQWTTLTNHVRAKLAKADKEGPATE